MNNKMSYSDFIERVATASGTPKTTIHDMLHEVINITRQGLETDEKVTVNGIGIFNLKWIETRSGRNPGTGESIEIPAQYKVYFKPEAALRRYINRDYAHLHPQVIKDSIVSKPVPEEQDAVAEFAPQIAETLPNDNLVTPDKKTEPETFPSRQNEIKEPPAPVMDSSEKEKSSSRKIWFWLLLILLLVILIFVFWPGKESEKAATVPVPKESVVPEAPAEVPPPEFKPTPPLPGTPGGTHAVQPGDKLWTIADTFYKDAFLWPNIYRVNSANLDNPDGLIVGIDIEVPPMQGKIGSLTEKDKKDVAEGYLQAYFTYKKIGKSNLHLYLWAARYYGGQKIIDANKDKLSSDDLKKMTALLK